MLYERKDRGKGKAERKAREKQGRNWTAEKKEIQMEALKRKEESDANRKSSRKKLPEAFDLIHTFYFLFLPLHDPYLRS